MNKITQIVIDNIHKDWLPLFNSTSINLVDLLDQTIIKVINTGHKLCPDHPSKILKALQVSPNNVRVVICGLDPYPQPNIATGISFACLDKWQPSLNILVRELGRELQDESIIERFDGTLQHWVDQGILMLNSSFSCEQWNAGSHSELWRSFTIELFKILNDLRLTRESMNPIVFVFLGKQAQSYLDIINDKLHYKILRNHPASEVYGSAKFEGFYCETNKYLRESNQEEIIWIDGK